jgi:RNA polymerase sigma-70 factor (ECF subfamily)
MTDGINAILEKAKKGDQEAENQLFDHLLTRFRIFARRKVNPAQAQDIAQEACLTVLKKYRSESFSVGFEAWSYGVLKNTIRNYRRGLKIRKKVMVPQPENEKGAGSSTPGMDHELRITLIDCLKKIFQVNPRYASVLDFIQQGYSIPEISKKLKITANNCYVILNRSRSMLKLCLETGRV